MIDEITLEHQSHNTRHPVNDTKKTLDLTYWIYKITFHIRISRARERGIGSRLNYLYGWNKSK